MHVADHLPQATAWSTRAILAFVLLTFGWTWSLWGISTGVPPDQPGLRKAAILAAGFGPSLAAIAAVAVFSGGKELRSWLCRCLAWRVRPGWYGVAFFAAPLAMLAALGIDLALGGGLPTVAAIGPALNVLAQLALVLIIGGPLGEEFGWRGFLLPGLATRCGWRRSSLIVGAIWGLWHLPLFYMAGTGQSQMPMPLFMASAVALSIVFARLSVHAGFSVLPALMLHWSINAWSLVIPVVPDGGSTRPYVLVMGILFVTAAIAALKPGPAVSVVARHKA